MRVPDRFGKAIDKHLNTVIFYIAVFLERRGDIPVNMERAPDYFCNWGMPGIFWDSAAPGLQQVAANRFDDIVSPAETKPIG